MLQHMRAHILHSPDEKGGGGDTGDKKASGEGDVGSATISKADYEKLVGDMEKVKQDLEDARLEVYTPEYTEFLESKVKGGEKREQSSKAGEVDISKMTPQQAFDHALKVSKEETQAEIKKLRDDFSSSSKASTQREIAVFARTHEDYPKFRPVMYGLSLDPKNKDLTIEELYSKAKEHVKTLVDGPTDKEKERSRRSAGEKPGSSSASFKRGDKKISPEEAAEEAWNEVAPEGLPG